MHLKARFALIPVLLACLAAGPLYAACTNPTGKEADQFYNGDYHTWQYCNGSNWVAYGGGFGTGAFSFISTQTASSSASLQFSGSSWSSGYNTLFLNCAGLVVGTTNASILVQLGEGAGPTWQTGAHYSLISIYSETGGSTAQQAATTTATDLLAGGTGPSNTTFPTSFRAYLDDVGSSTLYKNVSWTETQYNPTAPGFYDLRGSSYWNNDTNAITGIKLVPDSGNIASGTCSLYGMN